MLDTSPLPPPKKPVLPVDISELEPLTVPICAFTEPIEPELKELKSALLFYALPELLMLPESPPKKPPLPVSDFYEVEMELPTITDPKSTPDEPDAELLMELPTEFIEPESPKPRPFPVLVSELELATLPTSAFSVVEPLDVKLLPTALPALLTSPLSPPKNPDLPVDASC